MAQGRSFLISRGSKEQSVVANGMGRILDMPQAHEAVNQLGSNFVKKPGDYMTYIEPKLPRPKLEKLGQALVDFAFRVDDSPPKPIYEIKDLSDK
jgi:hypothetical protein